MVWEVPTNWRHGSRTALRFPLRVAVRHLLAWFLDMKLILLLDMQVSLWACVCWVRCVMSMVYLCTYPCDCVDVAAWLWGFCLNTSWIHELKATRKIPIISGEGYVSIAPITECCRDSSVGGQLISIKKQLWQMNWPYGWVIHGKVNIAEDLKKPWGL